MSDSETTQTRAAVDAILARAGLPTTPQEYERLVTIYPAIEAQLAEMRLPEVRNREPAMVYSAA